jgi:hypothetical protein
MVRVDPQAVRKEGTSWINLADNMARIRSAADGLWLGPTAFFIGNFSEVVHYPAYRDFHDRMLTRLRGAEVEFELIGLVLNRFADEYEETDQISRDEIDRLYTVTEGDVASVAEEDGPDPATPPGRTPGLQEYS